MEATSKTNAQTAGSSTSASTPALPSPSAQRTNDAACKFSLPSQALRALSLLEESGYEAWCVGGFVRDSLIGRACADIDIATDAPWQEVQRIFEAAECHTRETGTAHGTITVIIDGIAFEITTYRIDGAYLDGRHPEQVMPTRSIEEDLVRRDFTINALAYHPKRGLLDPFGGRADLESGILRTVGDPKKRFSEDALRILRACRFSSQLGFALEEETFATALSHKHLLNRIAAERIASELDRLLCGEHARDALMETVEILSMVLPELAAMKGLEQHSPYHIYDVLEHTAWTVQYTPKEPLLRWAALFHDAGKPASFFIGKDGVGHAYGHAFVSTQLARSAFQRLRLPGAMSNRALLLIAHHDDIIEPTQKAVKRALARLGGDPTLFAALCKLKRADSLAHAPTCIDRALIADQLEEVLACVLEQRQAFSLKDLAINGNDVLTLGVPQGRSVGAVLDAALQAVIDEKVENTRESLAAFTKKWFSEEGTWNSRPQEA